MSFFDNRKKSQRFKQEELDLIGKELIEKCKLNQSEKREKIILLLLKVKKDLSLTLMAFENKRALLDLRWRRAYIKFSWWEKLKYDEKLDFSVLDNQIKHLEDELKAFDEKYKGQVERLDKYFSDILTLSSRRINDSISKLKLVCKTEKIDDIDEDLFRKAFWFSMLSIPISAWNDFTTAHNIYDSLRSVNGNFEGLSDSDIWWESLFMSPESLAGLASLAKGAYFEQLVANDTGGELFEHFNNLGTDITIDGIEMQIKATDSVSYIASVDDEIPVIATSEVAEKTGAIDGGFTNEELTNLVELSLGGSVIDAKDTAIDAILTGAGTLGLLATINGINHAQEKFNSGVDGVEAIFEGAGVAIEGTAKGIVDASEMVYKAAMSKPSRFVGRTVLKGLKKLDEKLFEVPSKEGKR